MSCLERAIPDGHAKLSGEGEHARSGRRRLRRAVGRWRAMRETGFETVPCVRGFPRGRGKLRPWRARSRFQQGDANNDLQPVTVARASAPASGGSVPLPVQGRATYRGGAPPQCQAEVRPGTAALPAVTRISRTNADSNLVGTSRCDARRPGRAAGRRDGRRLVGKMKAVWSADGPGFRRLTLRSATGTAQRAILTGRDIGLTAVAPKRRYIAARRRKVRPISDHGNGNESIGKRHADQLAFNQLQSLLIPAEFAETKTAAGRCRMWRTRQAHGLNRPSPAWGGIFVAASGKDFQAPCRSDITGICLPEGAFELDFLRRSQVKCNLTIKLYGF